MVDFKILTKDNVKDFKNFKWNEFACHCNGKYCKAHEIPYSYELAETLQKIRSHFGKSLTITSPTRCVKHNAKQKNSSIKSNHTWYIYNKELGTTASDFYVSGVSYKKLVAYVKTLSNVSYYYNVSGSVMHITIKPKKINNSTSKKSYSGTFPKLPSRGYFKKGDKGNEVKNLQKLLNWAVDSKLSVDGIIGDKTISAVKKLQSKLLLKQDSLFGKNTLSKSKTLKK